MSKRQQEEGCFTLRHSIFYQQTLENFVMEGEIP
jgi:hypothetical protein